MKFWCLKKVTSKPAKISTQCKKVKFEVFSIFDPFFHVLKFPDPKIHDLDGTPSQPFQNLPRSVCSSLDAIISRSGPIFTLFGTLSKNVKNAFFHFFQFLKKLKKLKKVEKSEISCFHECATRNLSLLNFVNR